MYSAWYAGSGQVEVYCCQVWDEFYEITLWRMFGGALKWEEDLHT